MSAVRSSAKVAPPSIAASNSPSGFKDAAQLDQRAGQVGDPMQCQGADREVEARVAKRHQLGVGGDPQAGGLRQEAEGGLGGDDEFDTRPQRQRLRQPALTRAEIEHCPKSPADIVEAVGQPLGDFGMQKIDAALPRGALAVQAPGAAVEQHDRLAP